MKTPKSDKKPTPKAPKTPTSKPKPAAAAPLTPQFKLETLDISSIIRNDSTQIRVEMSQATIEEYAKVLRNGGRLPPPVVFRDRRGKLWLGDGHHTIGAHERVGHAQVECDVRLGSRQDAWIHAVTANDRHGLKLSNLDKAKIAATAVANKEWTGLSDRKLEIVLGRAVSREALRQARNARKASTGAAAASPDPSPSDNVVRRAAKDRGPDAPVKPAHVPLESEGSRNAVLAADEPYIVVGEAIHFDRMAEVEAGVTLAPYVGASVELDKTGTSTPDPAEVPPQAPEPCGVLSDLSGFVVESLRAEPNEPLAFWVSSGMIAVGVRRESSITVYQAQILGEITIDDDSSVSGSGAAGAAA